MKHIFNFLRKNRGAAISAVVVIGSCFMLVVYNYHYTYFFKASAVDILTILLGTIIVVFLTESLTDMRRRNDCIEHIIMEIEVFVSDDENFKISSTTYLKQQSCANRIKYLEDASFPDIQNDISFIASNYQNIRDLYSNHNKNEYELNRVKIDIDKHRDQIVDKCCKIRIGLYNH